MSVHFAQLNQPTKPPSFITVELNSTDFEDSLSLRTSRALTPDSERARALEFWNSSLRKELELLKLMESFAHSDSSNFLSAKSFTLSELLWALSLSTSGRETLRDFIPSIKSSFQYENNAFEEELVASKNHNHQNNIFLKSPRTLELERLLDFSNIANKEDLLWVLSSTISEGLSANRFPQLTTITNSHLSDLNISTLKVGTYNVWGLPGFGAYFRSRYGQIANRFQYSDLDIIALQELWNEETNTILNNPSYPYQATASSSPYFKKFAGQAILSKHPILESEFIPFKASFLKKVLDKGILYALIEAPGNKLVSVICVHLYSQKGGSTVRAKQVEEIHGFIKELQEKRAPGIPYIVLGDMNFSEHESTYSKLMQGFDMDLYRSTYGPLEKGNFDRELNGYTFNPEANAFARLSWDILPGGGKRRIDYILAGGFSPDSAIVIDSKLTMHKPDYRWNRFLPSIHLSDHSCVEGSLTFLS